MSLTLYWAPQSRSLRILWLLEELALPYVLEQVDIRAGEQHGDAFRALNPAGKVPVLRDGDLVLADSAAICVYLCDKLPSAFLAPRIEDPDRGRYLQWMFYAVGCMEPALTDQWLERESPTFQVAWPNFTTVMATLITELERDDYFLGHEFTAVDIMIGSELLWAVGEKLIADPRVDRYLDVLLKRPALQRAFKIEQV